MEIGRVEASSYGSAASLDLDYTAFLPKGFDSFEEFQKKFDLQNVSTEQPNPVTEKLSQTMQENIVDGLKLLLHGNDKVVAGFKEFCGVIETLAPDLGERLAKEGSVLFVGCGSSGRVGIDIAAKCIRAFPRFQSQIKARNGGGDSTNIRSKEGFENYPEKGEESIKSCDLDALSSVFFTSASGSAPYNVGGARTAKAKGANVYYFYNSKQVPSHTQKLFGDEQIATPLENDVGSQSIVGSTRLEAASLALACLGALLVCAIYWAIKRDDLAKKYPNLLHEKLMEVNQLLATVDEKQNPIHLQAIQKFIEHEVEAFCSPNSNFYKKVDTNQGYVTFLATKDSAEAVFDPVEAHPTFSLDAVPREDEPDAKMGIYHPYIVGVADNVEAGEGVLGRKVYPEDAKEMGMFTLAQKTTGMKGSYEKRPTGPGNFVIGVTKLKDLKETEGLFSLLEDVKKRGGKTGLIITTQQEIPQHLRERLKNMDCTLVLEQVPYDAVGIAESFLLKSILNMISNGSMILMNKVYGNEMIDLKGTANGKLIDRAIRMVKSLCFKRHIPLTLSNRHLYHYIAHVSVMKEEHKREYTSSINRIVLEMIALQKTPGDFKEIVERIIQKREALPGSS